MSKKSRARTSGRILTLRGKELFTGNGSREVTVLTNASPNRTTAWKVLDAKIWVESSEATGATAVVKTGSEFIISTQLQTDNMRTSDLLMADDNRCFGWFRSSYQVSKGTSNLIHQCLYREDNLDPDHLITDQMFQNLTYKGDNVGESSLVTICWMITLEQVKVTPVESILQTVKGRSQDVGA